MFMQRFKTLLAGHMFVKQLESVPAGQQQHHRQTSFRITQTNIRNFILQEEVVC